MTAAVGLSEGAVAHKLRRKRLLCRYEYSFARQHVYANECNFDRVSGAWSTANNKNNECIADTHTHTPLEVLVLSLALVLLLPASLLCTN